MTGVSGDDPAFRWWRLSPPIVLSLAILTAAPFLGVVRDLLLERFPEGTLLLGTAAVVVLIAVAFLFALVRIRHRRWLRYGGLGLCLALVWVQMTGFATGIPAVDVVERVHVVEYGLLAVLLYRAFRSLDVPAALLLTALCGVLVGILDEWLQWFVASRVGEVRDVWLNSAAVGTGALFALCLLPPNRFRGGMTPAERSAVSALAAILVLVFGGFYHCAHLGYEIRDEPLRLVFRSWYSAEDLPKVAAGRARQWAAGRLPSLDPLRREDYFFVEGTARVTRRNAHLQRGDVFSAWGEQRILERYYAPVLEQRGLRTGQLLGLTRAKREDLRRRAERMAPAVYSSPVLASRIAVTPSKPLWWTIVTVLATTLTGISLWPLRQAQLRKPTVNGRE